MLKSFLGKFARNFKPFAGKLRDEKEWYSRIVKYIETERGMVVTQGWGKGKGEMPLNEVQSFSLGW